MIWISLNVDSTSPVPSKNVFFKNRANSTASTNEEESESNEDEPTNNGEECGDKVALSSENLAVLSLKSRSQVLASLSSDMEDEDLEGDDFDRESCSSRRETMVFQRRNTDDINEK